MSFYQSKYFNASAFVIIFLFLIFTLKPIQAQEGPEIRVFTDEEESVSLSGEWRADGHGDWIFVGEGEGGQDLIMKETRAASHFFGREGEKEIILHPYQDNRLSRIIFPRQNLIRNIPEGPAELEDFFRFDLSKNKMGVLRISEEEFDQLSEEEIRERLEEGMIPEYITDFEDLRRFYLHENNFWGPFPDGIENLEELEYLFLDNNHLQTVEMDGVSIPGIPPGLTELDRLQELRLHDNELSTFIYGEFTPGFLERLRILTLKNNHISSRPQEEFHHLETVNVLNLKNNRIPYFFNAEDIRLDSLEYLNLSHNRLGAYEPYINLDEPLLPQIGDLESLQELNDYHFRRVWHPKQLLIDLRYNDYWGAVPEEIGNLEGLEALHLDGNRFTGEIPEEVENFGEYDEIDGEPFMPFTIFSAYGNHFTEEIPEELGVGSLDYLKQLRLHNNFFTGEIPQEVLNLSQKDINEPLYTLNLSHNRLESLEEPADSTARMFFLDRNDFEDLPENVRAGEVKVLSLEENLLEGLPENFGDNFANAKELSLFKNPDIDELPDSFEALQNLYFLDLGTLQLDEFPIEVTELINLEYLNLARQTTDKITWPGEIMENEIPEEIDQLVNLETFLIENNLIDELPEDAWSSLQNLRFFYGHHNEIDNLPESMGDMQNIERIYLNENKIEEEIPDNLTRTSQLRRIFLQYNSPDGRQTDGRGGIIGELPTNHAWGQLEYFLADTNEITGGIPERFVSNLPQLEWFSMYRNKLDGEIDPAIGNMESLEWWDIALSEDSSNDGAGSAGGLIGDIPPTIGNLEDLEVFNFNNNQIELVPDEINNLDNLMILHGFENMVEEFAEDIGGMDELCQLDFHNSEYGGNWVEQWPDGVEDLPNWVYFSFGENEVMEGTVPWDDWLGNYPDHAIWVNNNQLEGAFVDGMAEETRDMVFFNARDNDFDGNLPAN